MSSRPQPAHGESWAHSGPCPCGSGLTAQACCVRLHERLERTGELTAPTAEALMRSRFTAFARLAIEPTATRAMVDYLRATWDPDGRPSVADLTPSQDDPAAEFTRLAILDVRDGGPFHTAGEVEFVALGRHADGSRLRLHERSRFRREHGVWRYLDGHAPA
ncbi:MAG: YchJ family metal-binding protein [Micrococcus sp.]|nr:YchJ family metal-binding protein [Micrococcus sp.]